MQLLRALFICFCLLLSFGMQAQNFLAIDQCIELAMENNLNLQQAGLLKDRAAINVEQAEWARWPVLSGTGSHSYLFGRTIDPTENTFSNENIRANNFGLNGGVDLFNGFRIKNTLAASRLESAASVSDYEVASNNLVLTVALAYLQVISLDEQVSVLENQNGTLVEQMERMQKLIKAGVLAENDILQLEVEASNGELALVNAENSLQTAYVNLSQAMQYYDAFEVLKPDIDADALPSPSLLSIDDIYAEAIQSRPEIRAAELREEAAMKNFDATKGALYPRLSLGFGGNTNYSSRFLGIVPGSEGFDSRVIGVVEETQQVVSSLIPTVETEVLPFFDQMDQNLSWNAGLRLTVPIFNQFQTRKNMELAQLNIEQAKLNQKISRNNLFTEIQQALFTAQSAERSYQASKATITAAEKSLENTEKRFELGMSNSFEYSTARNNFLVAQIQNQVAKYEFVFRMKVLDYYQGKEITL